MDAVGGERVNSGIAFEHGHPLYRISLPMSSHVQRGGWVPHSQKRAFSRPRSAGLSGSDFAIRLCTFEKIMSSSVLAAESLAGGEAQCNGAWCAHNYGIGCTELETDRARIGRKPSAYYSGR